MTVNFEICQVAKIIYQFYCTSSYQQVISIKIEVVNFNSSKATQTLFFIIMTVSNVAAANREKGTNKLQFRRLLCSFAWKTLLLFIIILLMEGNVHNISLFMVSIVTEIVYMYI